MSKFPIPSYSQAGEDRLLLKVLWDRIPEPGFYVDVGCNHPTEYSNTYLLYLFGWRGLVIDADMTHLGAFQAERPNDIVLHRAVAETPADMAFYTFDDGCLNTLCPQTARQHQARGIPLRSVRSVKAERLDAILDGNQVTKIDLLDIDAEGVDLAVLRSNDWSRRRPEVIAIEDHDMSLAHVQGSAIYQFLTGVGYDLHSKVNYTAIYVARR